MRILDLIYPRACPICDGPVPLGDGYICSDCRKDIVYIHEPVCRKCGKQILDDGKMLCQDCENNMHFFDEGVALYDYLSMSKSLYRFKYNNRRDYAKFFGQEIAQNYEDRIIRWNPDAIIPIPLHHNRQRKRGYNQAALIAKEIGRNLDIPVLEKYVIRTKDTQALKKMDRVGRQNNLKNAFHIPHDDVKLKRVILVDDIYTTGSTVDAVAKILKEHGVGEVYYIAVSIGEGV